MSYLEPGERHSHTSRDPHEPYDSHGSIDPKMPHEHVRPANRVLRDLLVCIAEREELDEEHMSMCVRYVIANEQEIWNELIGPVIDRIADLANEDIGQLVDRAFESDPSIVLDQGV